MPVIDDRGKPLPPGHPFERPLIAFGQKRPNSSGSDSAPSPAPDADPMQPAIDAGETFLRERAAQQSAARGTTGSSKETANSSGDSGSSLQDSEKPLGPLEVTLEVLETTKDPPLKAKQERLLRILATSGVLPAALTASGTSHPMQPGIDKHEADMKAWAEQRRGARETTDPSSEPPLK